MSFLARFIPPIDLPNFFRLQSYSAGGQTSITVRWNVDGTPQERVTVLQKGTASLAEVVEAFPGAEHIKDNVSYKLARRYVGGIPLPPDWTLECGAAPEGFEGFLLTFDVGPKHFEKHLPVTKVQLNQLEDLIKWIAEANKIDRYKAGL